MSCFFTWSEGRLAGTSAYETKMFNNLHVYSRGLPDDVLREALEHYQAGSLSGFLDTLLQPEFFLLIAGEQECIIANDKFGSNEIFLHRDRNMLWITDDLARLAASTGKRFRVNRMAAYELLSFQGIRPPRTIYEDVSTVPMANIARCTINEIIYERYWNIERRLRNKVVDYNAFIRSLRNRFEFSLRLEARDDSGVSLSGGIDSGGILGALTKIFSRPVPSITIGGWGAKTPDLESSRATAAENESPNSEIYPSIAAIRKLPEFLRPLNQPVLADLLFPNCLIYECARKQGVKQLAFGFGAEMLLGNLRIAHAAHALIKFEKYLPRFLLDVAYRSYAAARRLSQNQKEFLLARTWPRRFLHARGSLFTRERHLYKNLPADFLDRIEEETADTHLAGASELDSIVSMYLFSWVNYMQRRDLGALGRPFEVSVIMPFDTPAVAEELFRAPDAFRRRNKWNKQVIRDVLRPFVSDRLYKGVVRSLIVPYSVLFATHHRPFIVYLRTSKLIGDLIDLERYEDEYLRLPEPGLNLMRLVGLAVWYDTHWNEENLKHFEAAVRAAAS